MNRQQKRKMMKTKFFRKTKKQATEAAVEKLYESLKKKWKEEGTSDEDCQNDTHRI